MPKTETGKTSPASGPLPAAKGKPKTAKKAKPVVSIEEFQALSSRFDALEERFNRLVKSHRFQF